MAAPSPPAERRGNPPQEQDRAYNYCMGMMAEGRRRARWIQLLILVLALTASRNNFPLPQSHGSPVTANPAQQIHDFSGVTKKYEGAAPSRRQLEPQQKDWIKTRDPDTASKTSPIPALTGHESVARFSEVRSEACGRLSDAFTRPKYLRLFLQAASPSRLPPPA
jgi:hypothetical protein